MSVVGWAKARLRRAHDLSRISSAGGGHASLCPPYAARSDVRALRTNRLDIVAVGIDQERGVIGRAVIGARPGAAIVAAAGFQAFGVELLDRRMILGAERDMRRRSRRSLVQMQPERRRALRAKARAGIVARAQHKAERSERRRIEAHAGVEISDA